MGSEMCIRDSTHTEEVVATDISQRALGYAALNAELAGIDLDLRAGSLLDLSLIHI